MTQKKGSTLIRKKRSNLRNSIYILIFILLSSSAVSNGFSNRLYIWQVGQGQWVTLAQDHACLHFDMGGEKAPKSRIKILCQNKNNYLYLSHADTDHISFIYWSKKNLMNLCLQSLPRETLSAKKKWLLGSVPRCKSDLKLVQELETPSELTKPNDMSRVFILKSGYGDILIPGDSTRAAEKYWAKLHDLIRVRVLLLGHHGSRTSTGDQLLSALPQLSLAISSSRLKRYGHPHAEVVDRLRKNKTPLLRTELWGNLSFEM